MNKVTAESRERDSAVTLFGSGDYCALTHSPPAESIDREKDRCVRACPFLMLFTKGLYPVGAGDSAGPPFTENFRVPIRADRVVRPYAAACQKPSLSFPEIVGAGDSAGPPFTFLTD